MTSNLWQGGNQRHSPSRKPSLTAPASHTITLVPSSYSSDSSSIQSLCDELILIPLFCLLDSEWLPRAPRIKPTPRSPFPDRNGPCQPPQPHLPLPGYSLALATLAWLSLNYLLKAHSSRGVFTPAVPFARQAVPRSSHDWFLLII